MRTTHFIAAVATVFLSSTCSVFAAPGAVSPHHPILGVWKWTTPNAGCSETYEFKPDGQLSFSSGEEQGVSEYGIEATPSVSSYYQFTDHVITDNGKNDCLSQPGRVGISATLYALFLPVGNQMMICHKDSMESCFGPLTRQ